MKLSVINWMQAAAVTATLWQCAGATEPVDALVDADDARRADVAALSAHLVKTESLNMLRESARNTHTARGAIKTNVAPPGIRRTRTPAMIEKMIQLEALPLVKVSDKNHHRLYFGIGFDGVVGLHGNF